MVHSSNSLISCVVMRVDDRGAGNESNKHGQQVCRSLPADEKLRANVRSFFQAPWLRLLLLIVSHIFRAVLRNLGMKPFFGMSLIFFGLATAMPVLRAQAQGGNGTPNSSQSNQAASPQSPDSAKQPAQVHSQSNANPFPEDTSNVPVMPTHDIRDCHRMPKALVTPPSTCLPMTWILCAARKMRVRLRKVERGVQAQAWQEWAICCPVQTTNRNLENATGEVLRVCWNTMRRRQKMRT